MFLDWLKFLISSSQKPHVQDGWEPMNKLNIHTF